MNEDIMYQVSAEVANEAQHLDDGRKILGWIGPNPREFDSNGLTLVKVLYSFEARLYLDRYELYIDGDGNYWIRHHEYDTTD